MWGVSVRPHLRVFKSSLIAVPLDPVNWDSALVAPAPSCLVPRLWRVDKPNTSECPMLVEPSSAWMMSSWTLPPVLVSRLLRTAPSSSSRTFYPPGTLLPSSSYNIQNYFPS